MAQSARDTKLPDDPMSSDDSFYSCGSPQTSSTERDTKAPSDTDVKPTSEGRESRWSRWWRYLSHPPASVGEGLELSGCGLHSTINNKTEIVPSRPPFTPIVSRGDNAISRGVSTAASYIWEKLWNHDTGTAASARDTTKPTSYAPAQPPVTTANDTSAQTPSITSYVANRVGAFASYIYNQISTHLPEQETVVDGTLLAATAVAVVMASYVVVKGMEQECWNDPIFNGLREGFRFGGQVLGGTAKVLWSLGKEVGSAVGDWYASTYD